MKKILEAFRQKVRNNVKFKRKNYWLYILIAKPDLYVRGLLKNTFAIGIVSFIMTYIYLNSSFNTNTLPSTLHSMIAVVIGLLLVFRTNSAYDRWWEARKLIDKLTSILHLFCLKLSINLEKDTAEKIKILMLVQFSLIKTFLQEANEQKSKIYRKEIISNFRELLMMIDINDNSIEVRNLTILETAIKEMIEVFNSLERIKDSPIPVSYSLHIKISVILYILSLPFGLFASFGLWSIVYVMIVYYIIAGIEIISNEIENPFTGDPNDLPLDEIFAEVREDILNIK